MPFGGTIGRVPAIRRGPERLRRADRSGRPTARGAASAVYASRAIGWKSLMPSNPSDPAAYDPAAGEKLIIETPEQTSIEFPLAGIGSRFLAILIDSLIQGAVLLALGLIFAGVIFGLGFNGLGRTSTGAVWIIAILIFAYFLLMYG